LVVRFNRPSPNNFAEKLKGMQAYPDGTRHGATLDPARIVALQFFGNRPTDSMQFAIHKVVATGKFDPAQFNVPQPFFPFIDSFGQYLHADWPGKTKTTEDLKKQKEMEAAKLAAQERPATHDQRGGWKDGPQLEATGHFRTIKRNSQWWLVTPEGRLFWSLGVDCVRLGSSTFVGNDRKNWFESLPDDGDILAKFYSTARSQRGDYKDQEMRTYEFGHANALQKYGIHWEIRVQQLAHRRLAAWGLNTFGCWSDPKFIAAGDTPYVDWVFHTPPRIRSWGLTRKLFADVFDPRFEKEFRRRAERMLARSSNDPRCIGVFSDNELSWENEDTLARVVMRAQADQIAKQHMVKWLRERYKEDIDAFNKAWKGSYKDWDELLSPQNVTTTPDSYRDLTDFTEVIARTYFETCKRVLKEVAPDKLYLGCRFATHNTRLVKIAAEYCDVVSFNIYRHTVKKWPVPGDIDAPIMIGEFHFGAPDRGVFGSGLVAVKNQQERAEAIQRYLRGAIEHPNIVGAHWFQYVDEPTSGRPLDSENHQIGLVDICDTPYHETIEAFQEIGSILYSLREKDAVSMAGQ